MKIEKLKNAPLKEAIFELLWELPLDRSGFPTDKEFDFAQGKFESNISSAFPVHKKISSLPNIKIFPKPVHQFWKGELTWPVIQFGEGIITVNDTAKNYSWKENYRDNIHIAIKALLNSYKQNLRFNKVTLRYLDSIDLLSNSDTLLSFLQGNFKTHLHNDFELPGKLSGINITQNFKTANNFNGVFNIQTALNNQNNKLALIWLTQIQKEGAISEIEIYEWIDEAHQICSDLFTKTISEEFYESFDR
jgi:uncharacterized protein (TIGR04255 family)